jgi:hypothetical protein
VLTGPQWPSNFHESTTHTISNISALPDEIS